MVCFSSSNESKQHSCELIDTLYAFRFCRVIPHLQTALRRLKLCGSNPHDLGQTVHDLL